MTEKRKKAGRPTKFSPEKANDIITVINAGNYIETAAAYAGLAKDTLYRWLRDGERLKEKGGKRTAEEEARVAFSDAVKKALATAEIRDVATIAAAAKDQWQAAAWRLERKYPDRWGRKERMAVDLNTDIILDFGGGQDGHKADGD